MQCSQMHLHSLGIVGSRVGRFPCISCLHCSLQVTFDVDTQRGTTALDVVRLTLSCCVIQGVHLQLVQLQACWWPCVIHRVQLRPTDQTAGAIATDAIKLVQLRSRSHIQGTHSFWHHSQGCLQLGLALGHAVITHTNPP